MLRQTKAKLLSVLTAALVTLLAALFSLLNNPAALQAQRQPKWAAAPADPRIEAGRRAYERLGCALCHSIAGAGSGASPLDAVGTRHDAAALRSWIVAAEPARKSLPPSIVRLKARYASEPDLDALVAYLQTLPAAKAAR
jgi:cbb3-type cytochrome oxidase cytochrome c subunit